MSIKMLRAAHYLPEDSYPLDVDVSFVTETVNVDTSTSDWWFVGSGDAQDILPQVESAIETQHIVGPGATVFVNSNFRVQIDLVGDHIAIIVGSRMADIMGFVVQQGPQIPTTIADQQFQGLWRPGRPASTDTRDQAHAIGATRTAISGVTRSTSFGTQKAQRDLAWTLCTREAVMLEFATTPATSFEQTWLNQIAVGAPMQLYEDDAYDSTALSGTYVCRNVGKHPYRRNGQWPYRWDVALDLIRE